MHAPWPQVSAELRTRLEGRVEQLEETVRVAEAIFSVLGEDWCRQVPAHRPLLTRYLALHEEAQAPMGKSAEALAELQAFEAALFAQVLERARERWRELPRGPTVVPDGVRPLLEGLAQRAPLEHGRFAEPTDGPGVLVMLALVGLALLGVSTLSVLMALMLTAVAALSLFKERKVTSWWLLDDALMVDEGAGLRRFALADVTRVEVDGDEVVFWGTDSRACLVRVRSARPRGVVGLVSLLRSPLFQSPRQTLPRLSMVVEGQRPDPLGGPAQLGTLVFDDGQAVWVPVGVAADAALKRLELRPPYPRFADATRELLLHDAATRQAVLRRLRQVAEVSDVPLAPATRLAREPHGWCLTWPGGQLVLELDPAEAALLQPMLKAERR